MGTPRSKAKVIQEWRNEYQVSVFPLVTSIFRQLLLSSSDQVARPDSTSISFKESPQILLLSGAPLLWLVNNRSLLLLCRVISRRRSRCLTTGADNSYQRPVFVFSGGTSIRHQTFCSSLESVLLSDI